LSPLASTLNHVLNHALHQNAWAADRLRPYAGKTIQFDLPPASIRLTLTNNGEFVSTADNTSTDAGITFTSVAALRLMTGLPVGQTDIRLQGDTELATEIGMILRQLEWDYEEDLSRLIGDIPAHQLVSKGRYASAEVRRQFWSVTSMFAEYWSEEQPLIAKKRHLANFSADVDTLRDDVERLAKRIERLKQKNT
jgi:ubiquinone biosynthesis protein UbiJ